MREEEEEGEGGRKRGRGMIIILSFSPEMVKEELVEIEEGRHPVIELLLKGGGQFVANDTKLSVSPMQPKCMGVFTMRLVWCLFIIEGFRTALHDHHWPQHGWEKLLHQAGMAWCGVVES